MPRPFLKCWYPLILAGYAGASGNSLARSTASIYGNKEDIYDRLRKHAYQGKKGEEEWVSLADKEEHFSGSGLLAQTNSRSLFI